MHAVGFSRSGAAQNHSPRKYSYFSTIRCLFQLETFDGVNWWHGMNLESYRTIDFIELAVNRDSQPSFPRKWESRTREAHSSPH